MSGVIICLIPDETYVAARPDIVDPHMTLAYFGKSEEMHHSAERRLKATVDQMARWGSPVAAKANGWGFFDNVMPEMVFVDLIDAPESHTLYNQLVILYSGHPNIPMDRTHGFTPHISNRKVQKGDMVDIGTPVIEFEFTKVALWFGDEKYEVAL
jgi:2'-5' RNA ligase